MLKNLTDTDLWIVCSDHYSTYLPLILSVYCQNLHHPGVINLERMYETPERVSRCYCPASVLFSDWVSL